MLIDPPSGWMYGFPKHMPDNVQDHRKWLVENGYPQKLIDELGEYFYIRYIGEESDAERVSESN